MVLPSQISPLSIMPSARSNGTISLCSTSCGSGFAFPSTRSYAQNRWMRSSVKPGVVSTEPVRSMRPAR